MDGGFRHHDGGTDSRFQNIQTGMSPSPPATQTAPSDTASIDWRAVARHFVALLVICAAVALLTTAIWPQHGFAAQYLYSLLIGLPTWSVIEWGRFMAPVRYRYRGHDGRHHAWPRGWRGVVLVACGIAAGWWVGEPLASWLLDRGPGEARDQRVSLVITVVAGIMASFFFFTRGQTSALQAEIAAAERDATEAKLRLLQSQLEPHMLFNTLANLRALIGVDPPAAQHMVDRLNDYLRATLAASRATAHPLSAEFERLRDYLELMAIRMGPRLRYQLDLPGALRDVPVPPLLLQPLVENAIRHGLESQVDGGRIDVDAAREGDALVLTVRDSGAGFDPTQPPRAGRFGMAQVTERVTTATGGRGHVDVQSQPGAGTTVRIALPWQDHAA